MFFMFVPFIEEKWQYVPKGKHPSVKLPNHLEDLLNANGKITRFVDNPAKTYEMDLALAGRWGVSQKGIPILSSEATIHPEVGPPITLRLIEFYRVPGRNFFGERNHLPLLGYGLCLDYHDSNKREDLSFIREAIKKSRFEKCQLKKK